MKKRNEGFTLLETLIAIVVLGIVVVPTCSSILMSFRMNAKTDQLLRDQLAVSSAVETLMAEGIAGESNDYGRITVDGTAEDRFPDVVITTTENGDYYSVTVKTNDGEVEVTTKIRAVGGGS